MIGITVIGGQVRTTRGPSTASASSGPPKADALTDDPKRHERVCEDGRIWDVERFECKTFSRTIWTGRGPDERESDDRDGRDDHHPGHRGRGRDHD
ncbi:hypothetical protein ACNOYE_14400 [Nannocystaceae bacterium ST9]